jgi:hypothetical protein
MMLLELVLLELPELLLSELLLSEELLSFPFSELLFSLELLEFPLPELLFLLLLELELLLEELLFALELVTFFAIRQQLSPDAQYVRSAPSTEAEQPPLLHSPLTLDVPHHLPKANT